MASRAKQLAQKYLIVSPFLFFAYNCNSNSILVTEISNFDIANKQPRRYERANQFNRLEGIKSLHPSESTHLPPGPNFFNNGGSSRFMMWNGLLLGWKRTREFRKRFEWKNWPHEKVKINEQGGGPTLFIELLSRGDRVHKLWEFRF